MKTASQVVSGLMAYMDKQLMPRLQKPQQFVAGIAMGLLATRAENAVQELSKHPAIKALGMMNENGINIDELYSLAKAQMRKQTDLPLDIPMIGRVTMTESDLDELYRAIQQA